MANDEAVTPQQYGHRCEYPERLGGCTAQASHSWPSHNFGAETIYRHYCAQHIEEAQTWPTMD